MAAAFVQSIGVVYQSNAGQTTTVLSPSSITVTAGNLIVVGWGSYQDVAASGVADNLGNTYTRVEDVGKAELWRAPVTTGGSITTITVTHASATNRTLLAAEFSGVGALDAVGGGTTGTGTTATWSSSKTIPANGLAVGFTFSDDAALHTAGSASGSPSTTVVRANYWEAADVGSSICYALAGGSTVSTFSGTTTLATSTPWCAAGGQFSPAVVTPTWTTPADTVSMSTTPELKFNSPASAAKQHFYLQLDTANTFDTGNLRTLDSSTDQTNWAYWDGDSWEALPSDGLPIAMAGNEVRYTVTSALSSATWYRRVRAGTGT
jgi:hypothetical protein